ncbi:MAG TPA: GYD domain-containing protein [Ignavibacteriaceae bacterium]|nr:GYD domain-containing protein [Ignavibacteriaceae bacterium]
MKTFILLTKLSSETSRQIKDRAKLGRAWLDQVKEKCPDVQFISHYALLGEYDFIDIYEAPDEETAAKVSMISLSNGAFQAQSLIAIPYKRFLELTEDISRQGIIV